MQHCTFTLYLDESGDSVLHSPEEYLKNPLRETHCTLLGLIFPNDEIPSLKEKLKEIKLKFWRTEDVVLHSVDMRYKKGVFAIFHHNPELYNHFKDDMNECMDFHHPVIICSSLNKKLWIEKYPQKLHFKDDPYEEAFVYLLERYAHFLNKQAEGSRGRIIAESRNAYKNAKLQKIYEHVRKHGTQYHDSAFFERIGGKIDFKAKIYNIPGLQLSDYCCYPFYKNHKDPSKENLHYDYLQKFVYPGEHSKYGHKKWPV